MNNANDHNYASALTQRLMFTGIAGMALAIGIGLARPSAFYFGYLCGFLLWIGVPLGGAGLLMIHHLTGGRWGWSIRQMLEAATASLPLIVLAFIPIALGVRLLYPWVAHGFPNKPDFAFRAWYLQEGFFFGRAIVFISLWVVGGVVLLFLTRRAAQCRAGGSGALQALSALGLILYFLTVSFASIDWILTLEPAFYSSVFGLYVILGQALTALAVFIVLALTLPCPHGAEPLPPAQLNDLGTLLLTFVVLHTYMAYSQFFIIWNGNLPDHGAWYAPRMTGFWALVSIALIVLHFLLPLFALLFRTVKKNPRRLLMIACVVLFARTLDSAWMVLPSAHGSWLAIVEAVLAMIGVGGIWLSVVVWLWSRSPAMATAREVAE
ncbi:MAG: hypothetical protein J5J06_10890 [Phycisphaerae bacterium]|nr:hypothetical protein [Phycisphaerae bacterium]